MFYRVGERKDGCIEWGRKDSDKPPRKRYYGSGAYPRVSLNNNNVVIEVRNGQYLDRCYYRIGEVNTISTKVTWGLSTFFDTGLCPDVALNNNNTVATVFQNSIFVKQVNYRIGKMTSAQNGVNWTNSKLKAGVAAERFSHAMNDNDMVVLSLQTPLNHHRVGVVDVERGVVEWCRSIHRSVGFTPCVSINNQNQVTNR